MALKDLENSIISRLQSQITAVPTEAFPENPKNYALKHPDGVILVSYHGSQFEDPSQGNVIFQDQKFEFDIVLIHRHLRNHQGAYDLLDQIRMALTGYQVAGYTKLYPVREQFISEENGLWQYGITFAFHGNHREM